MQQPFTYGSVCSGIEAATQAWHPLGWKPAFFSEIEKFPRAVLQHHYPDVPLHGDFTTIEAGQYDPIDLLVGGTPCQSFSIAGLRGGLGDDRGNLALEFLRLADRLGPRWLVWENVPGVFSSLSHPAPDQSPPDIDLDSEDGPEDGEEIVVTDEYESDESHALGCLLAGFSELGYGWAYRVLDAQFTRTRRFPWAVPQRRRRVFVVGYLGDWRRAAAVLFDRQSLSGDSAPRREAGKGFAPDFAPSLRAQGQSSHRLDSEAYVASQPVANPLTARMHKGVNTTMDEGQTMVVEGHDASEDGAGRGTPIIAFNSREDPEATGDRAGPLGASSPQAQAVAFDMRGRDGGAMPEGPHDTANIRASSGGSSRSYIATQWAVRRLTTIETGRLQGFPDNFTQIPWRGKPADQCPDGHQYKCHGNSMAVNVMEWLGERIQLVEQIMANQ